MLGKARRELLRPARRDGDSHADAGAERSRRLRERARGQRTVALRVRWLPGIANALWWFRTARGAHRQTRALRHVRATARWTTGARLLRRGFLPTSFALYGVGESALDPYLSDREALRTWSINLPASTLLNDKLAFYFMLTHLESPTPAVRGVIRDGVVHSLAGRERGGYAHLHECLTEHGQLVVRPVRGAGGRDVLVLRRNGSTYSVNGREIDWAGLERRLTELDDSLVTDFVEQGAYARSIFPKATNTLRVLTLNDADGAFIPHAEHRFGTERSGFVDNWSAGGLLAEVDVETGTLSGAVAHPAGHELVWHARHPDTKVAIEGTRVPRWDELTRHLVALAERTRFLPWVGWDVVVTDSGFSIIEGNSSPDVGLQIFRPLLADARVRAFFEHHGVLEQAHRRMATTPESRAHRPPAVRDDAPREAGARRGKAKTR